MQYTAGIFLFNKFGEILIVHPTNAPFNRWSIPKGIVDGGESIVEAAVRELYEETNVDLKKYKTVFNYTTEHVPYRNREKTLCPVFCKVIDDFNDVELKCNSLVDGQNFYENDIIKWISMEKGLPLIHETQRQAIKVNKLL